MWRKWRTSDLLRESTVGPGWFSGGKFFLLKVFKTEKKMGTAVWEKKIHRYPLNDRNATTEHLKIVCCQQRTDYMVVATSESIIRTTKKNKKKNT